jgi:dipeptidyl aminopeptidase/acylaminoacyl peptidase
MILGYPVISMNEAITHLETRENLLGAEPDDTIVHALSNETQVSDATPPTFLFHSAADDAVSVRNSILFHQACLEAKIPAELHVYEHGAHGVGLGQHDAAMKTWPVLCAGWLASHGWVEHERFRSQR